MGKVGKINDNQLSNYYNRGLTDAELAKMFSVGERTIRRRLSRLRAKGVIDYRKYVTKSKVLAKEPAQQETLISETELLKLLSLYKSRNKIAKQLKVSRSVIDNLCKEYGIVDVEYASKQLILSLKNILSDMRPYKMVARKNQPKGDTLVIDITDWHAGKIVKAQQGNVIYNEYIFKTRIDKLCAQLLKLLDRNIKKGVPITDAVIVATGDLANGENIYATQAYEQELAPPKQVMLVVETIAKLIKALVERKLVVRFYGVKGNHGRTGKDSDPSANWDLMIYMILDYWVREISKIKGVEINYTETDYMSFDVRGFKYLIRHIAPEQPDTPAGRVKFNEWARQHDADAIVYGHYHHFGVYDVDGIRVFRGGSVVGHDDLAERMAKQSEPTQLVWGVNDDRVSTFLYAVDLVNK